MAICCPHFACLTLEQWFPSRALLRTSTGSPDPGGLSRRRFHRKEALRRDRSRRYSPSRSRNRFPASWYLYSSNRLAAISLGNLLPSSLLCPIPSLQVLFIPHQRDGRPLFDLR